MGPAGQDGTTMTATDGTGRYASRTPELRVCVVGDDFVAGVGDPRSLGWVGRVGARTSRTESLVTLFPLGVPGETTTGLLARWREETGRRFADADPESFRLVIGLGHADLADGMSLARSRLNLANVLDECLARNLPVFVVGPPPADRAQHADLVPELSDAFADVCLRRRVPYVDCWRPLVHHEDWLTDMAAGDGRHPGQVGYGLMAWLVLHNGWAQWLGVAED
nr:GDSL-type esterase/lipase family protein [Kineosporia sp. A_224]